SMHALRTLVCWCEMVTSSGFARLRAMKWKRSGAARASATTHSHASCSGDSDEGNGVVSAPLEGRGAQRRAGQGAKAARLLHVGNGAHAARLRARGNLVDVRAAVLQCATARAQGWQQALPRPPRCPARNRTAWPLVTTTMSWSTSSRR